MVNTEQIFEDIFQQCGRQSVIFHAVKRFTKELSKTQAALTRKLSVEYGFVFHCRSDQGQKRTMVTPAKEIILSSLTLIDPSFYGL